MSTNKTQNYNLHSWLPQDEFHLTEINENFTGVDTELAVLDALLKAETAARTQQMAAKADTSALSTLAATVPGFRYGTYTGAGYGHPQTIELGVKPKIVFVCYNVGARGSSNGFAYAGMSIEGVAFSALTLTDTGFIVDTTSSSVFNDPGTYYYWALI